MSIKTLSVVGVAAATLMASTFLTTQSADARPGWRGGGGGGFYRTGGYYGGFRGGYRGGYRRGWGGGAAIGLGVAGLALGALAASTYPSYGYYGGGYPAYYGGGYPAYYGGGYYPANYGGGYYRTSYYGGGCTIQNRRVWGPYGWQLQRVRVCY